MNSESSGFREKTFEALNAQTEKVDEILVDQHIVPTSSKEEVFGLSVDELKVKFPKRYEIYLELLREKGREVQQLDEPEIEEFSKWLYVLNSLDRYIIEHHKESSEKTLRDKQLTVFEDLRNFLEKSETEGYIKLPTGTGKTVIFSEFVEALGQKTVIVVPKKILLEQTENALDKFTDNLEVGKIYGEAKERGKQVSIITYQSLLSELRNGKLDPEEFDCLILDEAHRSLTPQRMAAVKQFKNAIKIGFTATDKFSEAKQVSNILENEIHTMGIKEAVQEKMLAPFSTIFVKTEVDISEVPTFGSGEYNIADLEKAVNIAARNQAAVDLYQELFDGQKAIAYCSGINHAKKLADLFSDYGIMADVMHGKQSMTDQNRLKESLNTGKINVLCNADILIEGYDEPSASVCLNLRPTLSKVVAEQRAGRVLRLDPDNPEKESTVVDFIDKNSTGKNIQVTFAEIVEDSTVRALDDERTSELKSKNPNVVTSPDQVMLIASEMIERKYAEVPAGWMSQADLALFLGRRSKLLLPIVDDAHNKHPEWFGQYLGPDGRSREYFAPAMVKAMEEEYKITETAPSGWLTSKEVAAQLGRIVSKINKVAHRQEQEHPEWFKEFLDDRAMAVEHFSPQLVEYLLDFFGHYKND